MHRLILSLKNQIKSLSEPNPKIWPDPFIHQLIWNQNITNFYSSFTTIISFLLISAICNFALSIKLMVLGTNVLQVVVYLVFCRSYLWFCNLFFAISSLGTLVSVLEIVPDSVHYYIGLVFVFVATVMRKTRDPKISLLSGVAQIFVFLTRFKEKLIVVLEEEDPRIFADKFTKTTLVYYFILLLVSVGLFQTLDKKTLELSKSKSALENALEQKKTFILSFSHELRNPINSLLGNLQLVLQGEVLSVKAAEMISVAKVCGELLLHNINNVLDTGKQDIGKLEVNPVPTRLHELFQRTWSIYSELLKQKKLRSQLKIEKDLPTMVRIDAHKLNQVMLNLIGNAIKFTEKGSVIVTVKWLKNKELNEKCFQPIPYDDTDEGLFEKDENLSTMNTSRFSSTEFKFLSDCDDSRLNTSRSQQKVEGVNPLVETNGVLKIIVKDTGSGMKKESLEKLFQKFSQVSENISQRQIGTGLGLFITKKICLAMKGEVCAYSKFGIGTTFVVCIPTTSVPLTQAQRAGPERMINYLKEKHLKALVADDSPFNVNLICDYLSKFEASIASVAYNGYDAFRKYQEFQLDIVTLDIDMPIMDGRTVCDKIRKYEKEKKLKPAVIILISGNYDEDQMDDYLNPERGHRADYFLRKPVSFLDFTRTIYNLITQ